MAKRSLSDLREAETRDKAESLQRLGKELGCPVSDKQAHESADKRVRDAMERNVREGKV